MQNGQRATTTLRLCGAASRARHPRGSLRVVSEWATAAAVPTESALETLQRAAAARTMACVLTIGSKSETVLVAVIEASVLLRAEAREANAAFHAMLRRKAEK